MIYTKGQVFFLALLVTLLGACKQEVPGVSERPIVLVSVPPQAYFVERLAGDWVDIEVMVPPGSSPATFEPTINQMQAVSKARLYVTVGHPNFPFEKTWLKRLVGDNDLPLVSCTPEGLNSGDPHVWVSPSNALLMTDSIYAALLELLPEHSKELEVNRSALVEEIESLDRELTQALEPYRGQKFMVYHPAWGHFADHYGLVQIPIEEGMKEPSSASLSRLVKKAREDNIRLVFVQPQFSSESAELVAREIGGKVVAVDPLERDWAGSLRSMAEQLKEEFEP